MKEYPKECIIASSDVADLLRNFFFLLSFSFVVQAVLYEKFLNYFKLCLTNNPLKKNFIETTIYDKLSFTISGIYVFHFHCMENCI